MIAPLTREDIAMYGFHAKQQANPNLSRDPSPSESELAKVRAALRLVGRSVGPFDMACFGCDSGRHETRQYCPSCEEVTDSYPCAGDVA